MSDDTSWKRVVTLDLTNPPSEDRHLPSSDLHKQKKTNDFAQPCNKREEYHDTKINNHKNYITSVHSLTFLSHGTGNWTSCSLRLIRRRSCSLALRSAFP